MPKEQNTELAQERISQILGQGRILTMKNDLARLKKGVAEPPLAVYPVAPEKPLIEALPSEEDIIGRQKETEAEREIVRKIRLEAIEEEKEIEEKKEKEAEKTEKGKIKEEETEGIEEAKLIKEIQKKAREEAAKEIMAAAEKEKAPEKLPIREVSKKDLEQEMNELETELKELSFQKKPLELKMADLRIKKEESVKILSSLLEKEKEIEKTKKEIEEKEGAAADKKEKHKIEKGRWEIEKKRRDLEKEKWELENKIEKISAQMRGFDEKISSVSENEKGFEKKKEEISETIEKIGLGEEKAGLENELASAEKEKSAALNEKNGFQEKIRGLAKELSVLSEEEKEIEKTGLAVEEKEKMAESPAEERKLGKERWRTEEKRKEIEEKRWVVEKRIGDLEEKIKNAEAEAKEAAKRENGIREKIEKTEILLKYGIKKGKEMISQGEKKTVPPAAKPPEAAEKKEIREKIMEEERLKREIREKARIKEEEIKKIEEIRKMAEIEEKKPVSNGPVNKEKILKKLTQVSPEEKRGREEFLARISDTALGKQTPSWRTKEKEGKKEIVFRPVIKKSSFFEKILTRILIIALIAGLGFGIYLAAHYLLEKKPPLPPESNYPQTETTTQAASTEQATTTAATTTEATTAPASTETENLKEILFEGIRIKGLDYSTPPEILVFLSWILEEKTEAGKFFQIILKQKGENKILGLKEFLDNFEAKTPEAFSQTLTGNEIIFLYGSWVNRLGFIAEGGEGLSSAMTGWEATMADDLKQLLIFLAGRSVKFQTAFKTGKMGDFNFRYLDSDQRNFGICYAVLNNRLLFATSGESMMELIKIIKK